MKYFLGIAAFVFSLLIGWTLFKRYERKVEYVKEYRLFLQFLSTEMGVFKRKLKDIISEYAKGKKSEFCREISGEKTFSQPQVKVFLVKLNGADSESQKELLEIEKKYVDDTIVKEEKNKQTNGALLKKLCPLVGVAIFLLLL